MGKDKTTKNLLIISCSQRKKKIAGKIKAWDLYDGVVFRTLKKIEREKGLPKNLDILILSAKYGFIRPSELVNYYEHRLRKTDIRTKRDFFLSGLKCKVGGNNISTVLVCLGKDYLRSIEGVEKYFGDKTKILFANGGIGKMVSKVKDWVLTLISENGDGS